MWVPYRTEKQHINIAMNKYPVFQTEDKAAIWLIQHEVTCRKTQWFVGWLINKHTILYDLDSEQGSTSKIILFFSSLDTEWDTQPIQEEKALGTLRR